MVQQSLPTAGSPTGSPSSLPYLQHEPYLRRVALALTRGDSSEADDLLQETWLVALHHSPDHPESTRPWLVQVLRNRFRQGRRGSVRRDEREALVARSEIDPCDPAVLIAEGQVASALRGALHRLPESYALPLRLRFYEGLPPRHIASRMGMPVETIRTRLKRGLAGLRRDLCEDGAPRRRGTPIAALAAFGRPARRGLLAAPAVPMWLPVAAAAALAGLGLWIAQALFGGASAPPVALVQADQGQTASPRLVNDLRAASTPATQRDEGPALPLPPPLWSIQVQDESGRPLEGAEVFTRSTSAGHAIRSHGFTDAEGVLATDLGPGPHYIAAKHVDSQRRTRTLWVQAHDEQPGAELIAWPSEGFEFQVVDLESQPIADATVHLEPVQGAWWGKWDGAGSLHGEAWWLGSTALEPGRFLVHAEPRRQWRLRVRAPGYADWLSGKFDTRWEPPRSAVMAPPARLTGRVTDAGQPAGGVHVVARDAVTGEIQAETHTTGDGAYVFEELPRGQLMLVAQAGPLSGMGMVSTERPEIPPRHLKLGTASSVRGRVLDASGDPVAGRRVQLARIAHMTRSSHPGLQNARGRETHTDESGEFAFGGIGNGEHRVLVFDAEGQVPVAARMGLHAGKTPLAIKIQEPDVALGSVELRVPCGGGGEVWLTEPTLHVGAIAQVNAAGIANIDHLLPGLYEVALFRGQEPIDLGNVPLRAGQSLKTAPLGAPARCRVRVSLAPGVALADRGDLAEPVRIRARSTGEARTLPVVERYVRRSELLDGIRLKIPAGELVVEAVWGDLSFEARGSASAGGCISLELARVDSRHVRLRLEQPARLPGKGPVTVEVLDAEGKSRGVRHHSRQRLSDVQVSVFELPPGSYRALCMRAGAIHAQRTFEVDPGEDQLEIDLREL